MDTGRAQDKAKISINYRVFISEFNPLKKFVTFSVPDSIIGKRGQKPFVVELYPHSDVLKVIFNIVKTQTKLAPVYKLLESMPPLLL